jgi:hypothetical protein
MSRRISRIYDVVKPAHGWITCRVLLRTRHLSLARHFPPGRVNRIDQVRAIASSGSVYTTPSLTGAEGSTRLAALIRRDLHYQPARGTGHPQSVASSTLQFASNSRAGPRAASYRGADEGRLHEPGSNPSPPPMPAPRALLPINTIPWYRNRAIPTGGSRIRNLGPSRGLWLIRAVPRKNDVARVKAGRLLRRDRWFESGSLQRGVRCEPELSLAAGRKSCELSAHEFDSNSRARLVCSKCGASGCSSLNR